MNPAAPSEPAGRFLRPVTSRAVARALRPSVLWAYVAGVTAALALGLVALLTLIVAAIGWLFDRDLEIGGSVVRALGVSLWVVGPVALGAAVGAAAYASTRQRSLPRIVLGTAAAVAVAAALLALDASWFAAAALAFGWAIAIPADKAGRIAARGLPLIVAAAVATTAAWGRIGDLRAWQLSLIVAGSPLVAGVWVWLADAGYAALSSRPDPESGNLPPGSVVK